GDTEMKTGEIKAEDASDQGEGDVHQDQRRVFCGFKGIEKENEDQKDADGHDDQETVHGPLLVLELPAPGDERARGQGDLFDPFLNLGDDAPHISAFDKDPDGLEALSEFTADIQASLGGADPSHLLQGNAKTVGGIDEKSLDGFDILPLLFGETNRDGELL